MKKLMLTVLLLAGALTVQAQTDQGSLMVGGGLSFSSSTSKFGTTTSDPVTSFSITPRIGYFIADRFVAGLQLGYSTSNYNLFDDDENEEGNTRALAIGPYVRYFVPFGEDKFAFYVQGDFLYGTARFKPEGSSTDPDPIKTITAGISPGFTFFPAEKLGIDLQLSGFQFRNSSIGEGNTKISSTDISFGIESLSPSIGVNLFF